MKKHIHLHLLAVVVLFFTLLSARAQRGMGAGMGGAPPTPEFGGYMAKIFGDNANFSANIEMHSAGSDGVELVIPGKIATLDGKSRFWVDMTEMKGMKLPPQALAQMRMMGMDKMIMISRPDKNLSWMIYPGLQAYVETPGRDPESAKPASDFKIETTDLGKEDVDGHPCAKNKVVVTDKDGKAHEATVWSETDLKNFPLKIQTMEGGRTATMVFTAVNLANPDAALFEPSPDYTKYGDRMALMQQEVMKRMGAARGAPPGQP